jgi:acetolactate synthase-1/2/3 large subunit
VEVVGDLAHTLWMFNERVDRDGGPLLRSREPGGGASRHAARSSSTYKDDTTAGQIRPQKALFGPARKVLGPDDVLLSDVGAHKMWIARHYHCHEPNTCLIPNGFCSMGFALPGAIAASFVHPERRMVAICGDGGFLMNVQEMETAVRLGVSLTVLVWEDGGYGLISWKQDNEFGSHTELAFGNPGLAASRRELRLARSPREPQPRPACRARDRRDRSRSEPGRAAGGLP